MMTPNEMMNEKYIHQLADLFPQVVDVYPSGYKTLKIQPWKLIRLAIKEIRSLRAKQSKLEDLRLDRESPPLDTAHHKR